MGNSFNGLSIASNALRSFQRALDTTGHNVANVNTPGYSRQVLTFGAAASTPFYGGNGEMQLGGGVTILSLSRIRDQYLDARRQSAQSGQGQFDALNTSLGEVQSVFQDVSGKGVSDALSGFFTSWSKLSADPSQSANRLQVQSSAQTLADNIRGTYSQLQTLQSQQTQVVNGTLADIQSIANKIATLNQQIRESTAGGGQANDLLDQRDQAVQSLSNLTNVTTNVFQDGTMVVNVGGFGLVDAQGANDFPSASFDPATQTVSDGTRSYPITSGQLAGAMKSLNNIKGYMGNLDNLANTLRTQVNSLHMTGVNPEGNTGVQFFNDSTPQTGAINFDLSAAVKNDPNAIVTSVDGTAGDGGIALAMSQLQDAKLPGLGNTTFSKYYGNLVAQVGSDAQAATNQLDTQNSVAQQIDSQIASVSGVSLDDEMANMLQFQRSYQAAAKTLTIFDQVTQDLINMVQR